MLFYLVFFFALYCFLWILPPLLDVLGSTPAGPAQEEIAKEATRRALAGKLAPTFVLAIATVGVGGYLQVLPGLRPRS